jgi:transposase
MQVITIGIDLAKNVFQVHGVDANDKVVFNKPLRRSQVLPFFAKLGPCLIGMEACGLPIIGGASSRSSSTTYG